MGKAKAHPDQFGFVFEPPKPASAEGSLAALEAEIAQMMGSILNSDARPRERLAAEVSLIVGESVSKAMLDAYSSPARPDHKVPMSRALALIAVTGRHDLLDPIMRRIGAALVVGDEVNTVRLGHIDQQIEKLRAEKKQIKAIAPLIRGGANG